MICGDGGIAIRKKGAKRLWQNGICKYIAQLARGSARVFLQLTQPFLLLSDYHSNREPWDNWCNEVPERHIF